jgi:hypothetical protein
MAGSLWRNSVTEQVSIWLMKRALTGQRRPAVEQNSLDIFFAPRTLLASFRSFFSVHEVIAFGQRATEARTPGFFIPVPGLCYRYPNR